jgi:formate/nitrite transporter FocA (FNT family)
MSETNKQLPTHPETEISEPLTDRSLERLAEDRTWVPVIVKRTDEARRHPDDILMAVIEEGVEQLSRPTFSLGLSAVAAGLMLGFTAMAVAVVSVAAQPLADWPMLERLAVALVYPLGFVLCLTSGAELFTEHTATAVYPVLDRKARVSSLLRLWVTIIVGNLIGAFVSASLMIGADSVIGARDGYIEIGRHLVAFPSMALLLSAVLAGWLMALGAWLIMATPPTVSQIVSIYIVTFLIGLGGLHHSIAGAVEIFAAVLASNEFGAAEVGSFLSLALLGNMIGGSLFVAALNYAHIRKSRELQDG